MDAPNAIGAAASDEQERRAPHVEDTLDRLGRSLTAAMDQAPDYGVAEQGCRPGPFILLSVPPVLLWRVDEVCDNEGGMNGRFF